MKAVLELSFEELNALLSALQTHLRDDQGTITPLGVQYYQALHDRLEALWLALDAEADPRPPAVNDDLRGPLH